MTVLPLSEVDEGDTSDIQAIHTDTKLGDIEFWSNGEFVRFGKDVESGECVEIDPVSFNDFASHVRRGEEGHEEFRGRGTLNSYLFGKNYITINVYHNQTHVMRFSDHERYPLDKLQRLIKDVQVDWDVETKAEKIIEQQTAGTRSKIDVEAFRNGKAKVTLTGSSYNYPLHVTLATMPHNCQTEVNEETNLDITSQSELASTMKSVLGSVEVRYTDDSMVEYSLTIDTQKT